MGFREEEEEEKDDEDERWGRWGLANCVESKASMTNGFFSSSHFNLEEMPFLCVCVCGYVEE